MTGRTLLLVAIALPLVCDRGRTQQALTDAAPPAGAELTRLLRETGLDPDECYRVRDLRLAKEDLRIFFNDGYLIFSKPIHGERVAAVFTGEVENGDGEILLLPPYRGERQSLARFTASPNLGEHFRAALLIFTDGSAQTLLDEVVKNNGGKKAPEMGPLLAQQWSPVVANVQEGFELRIVRDLLTPVPNRLSFMFAGIAGKKLGNFDLFYDTQAQEQIMAGQLAERNGRSLYDIWTSFPSRSARNGAAKVPDSTYTSQRYTIDAGLDATLRLKAKVHIDVTIGRSPARVLPFSIARSVEVTSARIDGKPAEVLFHESTRGRAVREGDDDPFLLIAGDPLAPSSTHEVDIEEEGSVITPTGKDVYFVGARASWYPHSGVDFSTYDLTFRYPRRLTLVSAGDVMEDRTDGDWRITRRVTAVPIRVAGFNLGDYEKIAVGTSGLRVEVYGNRRLEAALQPKMTETIVESQSLPALRLPGGRGGGRASTAPSVQTTLPPPPDPLARLRIVASDVSSSLQFYSTIYGPPALPSLTVSPIPGAFGQGFPGLVYLSTLSYLDPGARPASSRGPEEQVFFSDLIEAHEVAHQWWGNVVLPAGYQDEWICEALSSYSALMYLEKKKGPKALTDVLENYRDSLTRKMDNGQMVDSAGPITWGFRLESSSSNQAWRSITYNKGAWIFHMLRRRLGDERFFKMLAGLRRQYEKRTISTAELRTFIKQDLPPKFTPTMVDEFFDNWVYASGIPALKLTYSVKGAAPAVRLTGQVEQSGVDDDFSAEIPVEVQFAKGAPQVIWVQTASSAAPFSATLKQAPSRVSIPAGTGVLATKK